MTTARSATRVNNAVDGEYSRRTSLIVAFKKGRRAMVSSVAAPTWARSISSRSCETMSGCMANSSPLQNCRWLGSPDKWVAQLRCAVTWHKRIKELQPEYPQCQLRCEITVRLNNRDDCLSTERSIIQFQGPFMKNKMNPVPQTERERKPYSWRRRCPSPSNDGKCCAK